METVALLAMMVMPNLLLQSPHPSGPHQDRVKCLERRMDLWIDGKFEELFQEGQIIQKLLARRSKSNHAKLDDENITRQFSQNMHQGKVKAALRLLSPSTRGSVLPLDELIPGSDGSASSVRDILKAKHPPPGEIHPEALLPDGPGAKMPSFADDMTLYCSHTSAALACSSVSAALKDTSRALALRGLSINVSKTVAMVIAPHSRACQGLPTDVRLLLQNEEVKLVSQTRLLGIIIDDSLSWSPHVDSICKKVGRKIGALRRTYRQLTPTARRQFFVSVIQPDLEYAASATIPFMPTGQQDRLLALWKKAVRCLAGVHSQDDVLPLIRNLKLTLLSHRWSLQLFTTIRRCHQQSAPALLLEKLSFHEHQHSTRGRQQGDFRPFQPASLAGRISFTNRAPLLWNMLPREVQASSSMLVFKKNVLSLFDSPASGKNLLQICFGNTTI